MKREVDKNFYFLKNRYYKRKQDDTLSMDNIKRSKRFQLKSTPTNIAINNPKILQENFFFIAMQ